MFKTLLAILTVLAVVAVGGLLRLPLLPFQALRSLFRAAPEPARLTAD